MKTWLAGLVLFAGLAATAQADIVAGTVIDLASKRPVAGANVTVVVKSGAPPLQTKTDSAGRFTLDVADTPVSVSVQATGFEPYVMHLTAVAPSVTANLQLAVWRHFVWEHGHYRHLCAAFQPDQVWDRYSFDSGGVCGTLRF
jgi:hypothetical protein